jgi:hypothetical protein
MGTSSCATISIGGFKKGDQKKLNEEYKANKTLPNSAGMSVQEFYDEIIVPISQPLGKTQDLPFTKMMEDITTGGLHTKLCMAVLNDYQYQGDNRYWHEELKKWDFKLITKTYNDLGTVNYVYMRNPNVREIEAGEE